MKALNGLVTNMQTVKQIVHKIADQLPEQASFDDAMRILYVRQKLERSLQAAREGNVATQEEMERQFLPDAG